MTDPGLRSSAAPAGIDLAAALLTGEIVDCSVTLDERLPASWPTHMPFQRKVYSWFENRQGPPQDVQGWRGPYHTGWVTLDEHCGTHVDAPSHFIPPPDSGLANAAEIGLRNGDALELREMIGPAAVIDVTDLVGQADPGASPIVSAERIAAWEAEHGRLQPGDIALFASGWDRHYRPMPEGSAFVIDPIVNRSAPGWPTPGVDALQLLLDRGVTTLGLDGASVGACHDLLTPHLFGLSRGMIYIEVLANLDKLPPRGAIFICLPLKIAGSSACPARAIAIVPRGSAKQGGAE
ncbi:MAG: cyclase family protein [Thermomicrobiales bacterium]|nr:cyclase family protein [Thermomicrobiales bacterium]